MKKILLLLFFLLNLNLFGAEKYHVTIIDSQIPGRLTFVTDINAKGDVLGFIVDEHSYSFLDSDRNITIKQGNPWSFLWNKEYGFMFLGTGSNKLGLSLNDAGQIAGIGNKGHWLYDKGTFSIIDVQGKLIKLLNNGKLIVDGPGNYLHPVNANEMGDLVGTSGMYATLNDSILLPNKSFTNSMGVAVNNSKQVVGVYKIEGRSNNQEIDFFLPYTQYFPSKILRSTMNSMHAYLWDKKYVDLGALGGNLSVALDINDHTQVVGWSSTGKSIPDYNVKGFVRNVIHAVLWENENMIDLNNSLSNLDGRDIEIKAAIKINDSGQIVALGYANGKIVSFLLDPLE